MMDETEVFLALSSELCGVAVDSFQAATSGAHFPTFPKAGDLHPRNTPIDRASEFLETLREQLGKDVLTLVLTRFENATKTMTKAKAAEDRLNDSSDGPVCQSIMKMWFLGMWFAPAEPHKPSHVISTQAYKEALIWKVMQSHPQGYSVWAFGYWSTDPPPLENFVKMQKQDI